MSEAVAHPRIKPIYSVYRLDQRSFRIGAQLGITAEFDDPDGHMWELVSVLDGRPMAQAIRAVRDKFPELTHEDVTAGIQLLDDEGFLEDSISRGGQFDTASRYSPNVAYFSKFSGLKQDRFAPQRVLRRTKILLLGLGGAGSNILALLVGLGPDRITIVDHDRVEDANLGRQILYRENDRGRKKTAVAAEAARQMNSDVEIKPVDLKVESVDHPRPLLGDCDIVISAIDEPPFVAQRIVNKAIVEANVPCVFGASQVTRGRVYTVIPRKTGCFDCLNVHYTQRDPQFVAQFAAFQRIDFDPPSIAYAPAIYFLTATIVDEAVRVLTHYALPRSLGTQYELDYEAASSFSHPSWPRLEDLCPTCGTGRSSDWEVFGHYARDV